MRFQVFDWEVEDVEESLLPDEQVRERARPTAKKTRGSHGEPFEPQERKMYTAIMYGRTAERRSVAVRLTQYLPFFYLKIDGLPSLAGMEAPRRVLDHITGLVGSHVRDEVRSASTKSKVDFFGFRAGETSEYVSVAFDSMRAMKQAAAKLRAGRGVTLMMPATGREHRIFLYESRIEPLSRLLHARDVQSAGWVEVRGGVEGTWSTTDICITAGYRSVSAVESDAIAPALISVFDIECTSCCGDFPVPMKTFRKVANNIRDVMAAAEPHAPTKEQRRALVQGVVLMTLGLDIPRGHAAVGAREWLTERSPAVMTERMLGFVVPKRRVSAEGVLRKLAPMVDDLVVFSTVGVQYLDSDMPRTKVEQMEELLQRTEIQLEGDPVIQIGMTSHRIGEAVCFDKWICTLGTCDAIEGVHVVPCETESDLLLAFAERVGEIDPDVISGYNIYGFDMRYVYHRAQELGIDRQFMGRLGRLHDRGAVFRERKLSSSALGDNVYWLLEMPGRVCVDLMKVVMREHNLESYKLDNVAHHFTGERKRDVSPKEIFALQKGSAADRAVIADYCVQDCVLCNSLLEKLKVLTNALAMASMSYVPLSYIFLRGQGVKILSLVSYHCRRRNMIIKDLPKPLEPPPEGSPDWMMRRYAEEKQTARRFGDEKEEAVDVQGAIVLEPNTGFYVEDPVAVCDYASLYPSSIMSHGISPDARVTDDKYRGMPGYKYVDDSYDLFDGEGDEKRVTGKETLTFAKREDEDVMNPDTMAIIPAIERMLLARRKSVRKKIQHKRARLGDGAVVVGECVDLGGGRRRIGGREFGEEEVVELGDAYNDFTKAVLDGQQLSMKLLANSVYGQLGARTSDIRDPKLAACVTAVGRGLILSAKDFIQKNGGTVVYGDTDSVFCTFPVYCPHTGNRLKGRDALPHVIAKAKRVGGEFTRTVLPKPHDLEYEKTFWPLLLLAKKKYVSNMYEEDPSEFKLKYMGIVLKRRDNAPIVRRVVKALLDRLLNEMDVEASVRDVMVVLEEVMQGRVPMDDLVITKTLRSEYKDRSKIAHAVLAQRIGERDPGNAPQVNDRIPMVHIRVEQRPGVKLLQGDKVEDPVFVAEKGLEIDYEYYMENQIMNPTLQILSALVEHLPGYNIPEGYWSRHEADLTLRYSRDPRGYSEDVVRKKVREAIDRAKQAEAKRIVFDPKLAVLRNKYCRQRDLFSMGFFAGSERMRRYLE